MSIEETIRLIIREEVQAAIGELIKELRISNNSKEYPNVLNVEEVAEILRVSKDTVYKLSNRNDFPAVRSGRRILVPRDRLFEWMENKASMEKYLDAGNGIGIKNSKYF